VHGAPRNLVDRPLSAEYARVNSPKILPLEAPLAINGNATKAYEIEVFNALLRDRSTLGIKQVSSAGTSASTACLSSTTVEATKEYGLSGAVVVFEQFSGDWALRKTKWLLQNVGTTG
jgi:hypothetical protein